MTGTRQEKKRHAEKVIKEHLLLLRPGEPMPPLRVLMEESGLGRTMLDAAIKLYTDQGLLETRPRQGIFRTEKNRHTDSEQIVDIVACSEISYLSLPHTFFGEVVEELMDLATCGGQSVRIHKISFSDLVARYADLIREKKIQQAVLVSPHNEEVVKIFEAAHTRFVSLLPRFIPQKGPALVDVDGVVSLQLNHLFELGHSKVAYIDEFNSEAPSFTHLKRRENYYRIMAERGNRICPEWVIPISTNENELFASLDRTFSTRPMPTALISCDVLLPSVYRYINLRGWKVGKDISVIGFDGMESTRLRPRPTTVINSRATIARMAWDMLSRLKVEPGYNEIKSVPLLMEKGESTAPVNENVFCNV